MLGIRALGLPIQTRRMGEEVLLYVAIGLFMGAIAPFGTDAVRAGPLMSYWLICMVGGGLIGIRLDRFWHGRIARLDRRTLVVAATMTPAVALLVLTAGHILIWQSLGMAAYLRLLWKVFVVSLAAMTVRALVWRQADPVVTTRIVIEAPLPEAEVAFRRRLGAKRRSARLIAVEAHDHYLRVHTDAGTELVTMRFADALADLRYAQGYRVHRSWWVSASAIEGVRWRRGAGEAHLVGELIAPVSRSYKEVLTAAGWL